MTAARRLAFAILIALVPADAGAQCPDGSPHPCARPRVAPPLDDATWIVVPFNNATRTPDIDWLRDGSVGLLSLDLSRWRDIRVVDDKRVADFVRDIPSARRGQTLSLSDALALAKRAGAGRLVMGDVYRTGSTTAVATSVYDVRRGTRIRTTRAESVSDSVIHLFGRVAREVLALPAPPGATSAAIGTTRVDAYREYLAGTQALNRFAVTEAKEHLERALQLDSLFALAHYRLAIATMYDEAAAAERLRQGEVASVQLGMADDEARLEHATTALRLAAGLPERERGLIAGLVGLAKSDYAQACSTYAVLVAKDSSDVEALFGLGDCLFRDDVVEASSGDTTRLRFRSSWNLSMRTLRRALAVDPTFHLAFDPILDMLTAPMRPGCRPSEAVPTCAVNLTDFAALRNMARVPRYFVEVKSSGDTLVTEPTALSTPQAITAAGGSVGQRANMERAFRAAQEWVEMAPGESRARRMLGFVALNLGRVTAADSQFAWIARGGASPDEPDVLAYRAEVALKLGRGNEFVRLVDSIALRAGTGFGRIDIAKWMPIVGRFAPYDTGAAQLLATGPMRQIASMPGSPAMQARMQAMFASMRRYAGHAVRGVFGVATDSAYASERDILGIAAVSGGGRVCGATCVKMLAPTLTYGLRIPRAEWPTFDSTVKEPRFGPALALARGDTTALRLAARRLDSVSRVQVRDRMPDDGSSAIAAQAFLQLGDSARAYAAVGRLLELMMFTPMSGTLEEGSAMSISSMAYLWPPAMLLRAELAAARGERDEARKWSRRFLDLWVRPDAEARVLVERARMAHGP